MYSLAISHDRQGMVTQSKALKSWSYGICSKKERAVSAGAQLGLFSTQSGTPECVVITSQGNQYRYPHRPTQRCASMAIPNPWRLKKKVKSHRSQTQCFI